MSDSDSFAVVDEGQELWLTLADASSLLGVSPSTVRRWSDEGRIPAQRTSGGHRRFDPAAVRSLLKANRGPDRYAEAVSVWPAPPEQVAAQPWHAQMSSQHSVEQMRPLGQRLLGLLIQFLVWQGDGERFLQDGRAVGADYGRLARLGGVSMRDTVQAFIFFRATFWRMALQLPVVSHVDDAAEMRALTEKIDHFMNEVLLATIDGYESTPLPAPENS